MRCFLCINYILMELGGTTETHFTTETTELSELHSIQDKTTQSGTAEGQIGKKVQLLIP